MEKLSEMLKKFQGISETKQAGQTELKDREYRGKDGLIYCSVCGKSCSIKICGREFRRLCDCERKKLENESIIRQQREKTMRIEKIKKLSLLGRRYQTASFENTEQNSESFCYAFERCKKYCESAKNRKISGVGMYLWGTKGVGKTRLSTCVANGLMNQEYTVLFTNFSKIFGISRKLFGQTNRLEYSEQEILSRVETVDFLFIDDFGVERVTKDGEDLWLQEKIFDVVNTRYNENLPIIFTSNFSLRELVTMRGLDDRTVDRIMETSEILKICGASYRKQLKFAERLG